MSHIKTAIAGLNPETGICCYVGDQSEGSLMEAISQGLILVPVTPAQARAFLGEAFTISAIPVDRDEQVSALRKSGLSIDGDNAYKRDLIDTIVGAMAFGFQGVNPPPEGHWGRQFWDIGRAEGEERERLRAALKFYADREHFHFESDNWDSVSGEPSNILWHSEEADFIEDGEVARAALSANAQAAAPQCDHQWTDDGEHLLICTECGTQEDHDPKWRDMATAPRDGTMLRLLVEFTDHATEDADQAPTIGANNFDNDGEDRWQFAGWCWSHDHFTEGKGEPVGWLPMLDGPKRAQPADGVESDE